MSGIIILLFGQGKGGVYTLLDGIAVGLTVVQALFMADIIDKTIMNIDNNKKSQ